MNCTDSHDSSQTRPCALAKISRQKCSFSLDRIFVGLTLAAALLIPIIAVLVVAELTVSSRQALHHFGWRFLTNTNWDPGSNQFGALPFVFGTLATSFIALLLATPLSIGTALFLSEWAPKWLDTAVTLVIELLATIPSVIIGLWGIFVLVPFLREILFPVLQETFHGLPLFAGPIYGVSLLAAGIVLAIMIVPLITSVSREILRSVPASQREAAFALGATKWEVARIAVLSYAREGLIGAVVLGLGRALGETVAVTMVIGNRPEIGWSLFTPSHTLASVIANEFADTSSDLYQSTLFELGLILLLLTIAVNVSGQLLVRAASFTSRPTAS